MILKTNLFLILLLIACSPKKITTKANKPRVITTFTIIADMARNIAGDKVTIESITKPGAEIHDYQPTPKDIIKAQDADAIFWNGMNLERWFEKFFNNLNNVSSYTLTKGIQPLSIYGGPYTGRPNPHAWMSIDNAFIYIENITQALIQISPKNEAYFKNNKEIYKKKLIAIKKEIALNLNSVPIKKRYLVTSEGAFSYLAKDLQMKELYLWPINAEQQGSPKQIKKVIDQIKREKIPVVFSESTVSNKPAKQIANETNAIYGGVLYVDSLSKPDGVVPTYIDLLKITTQTIVNGFNKSKEE